MTDQSLFEENKNLEETPPVEAQPTDPYADLLESIRNERGERKYATLDEALKALKHSQEYIPTLKAELIEKDTKLQELQMEQTRIAQLEEAIERLATAKPNGDGTPPSTRALDEQTLKSLVSKQLEEIDSVKRSEQNLSKVQDALLAKYGEKAAEVLAQKASELGTTKEALGALARQNPNMVLAYFNTQGPSGPKPSTSSMNIPPINKPNLEVQKPEKSMLLGATDKDRIELLRKIRESVHAKYGVEN